MQTADIKKDCNLFTVCVAIGMFVLGLWRITLPSFLFLQNRSIPKQSVTLSFALLVQQRKMLTDTPDEELLARSDRPLAHRRKQDVEGFNDKDRQKKTRR